MAASPGHLPGSSKAVPANRHPSVSEWTATQGRQDGRMLCPLGDRCGCAQTPGLDHLTPNNRPNDEAPSGPFHCLPWVESAIFLALNLCNFLNLCGNLGRLKRNTGAVLHHSCRGCRPCFPIQSGDWVTQWNGTDGRHIHRLPPWGLIVSCA